MKQYLDLLKIILDNGDQRPDRTGTGTISVFGYQSRYDLRIGFPAMTTKKLAWKAVTSELLWFLSGSTNERDLCEILHGTRNLEKKTIWTDNAQADYWKPKAQFEGDIGLGYGYQWRNWGPRIGPKIDQISNLIEGIKKNPFGRRHILTMWNPGEIDKAALPPCHLLVQFYINSKMELSCQFYIRSNDVFLGAPFNISSYALLTHMVAQICELKVGDLIHTIGDAHLYINHLDQVAEQLARDPYPLPELALNPMIKDITKFTMDDIKLLRYQHHGPIKAEMAV